MSDAAEKLPPAPGRPVYGPAEYDRVIERLEQGWSLRRACGDEGMPHPATVIGKVRDDPEYAKRYARARLIGYQLLAEELIEIADDGRNDTVVNENGDEVTNHDVIARSKLRIDTRKWMLAKMLPKAYGEKVALVGGDPGDGPMRIEVVRKVVAAPGKNRVAAHSNGGNGHGS